MSFRVLILVALAAVFAAAYSLGYDVSWGFWASFGIALLAFLAVFVGLWLLLGVFLLILAIIAGPVDKRRPYSPFYAGVVSFVEGLLLGLCSARVREVGFEKLPEGRFLLVCNHRSNFDPIAMGWALRERRFAFVTKPSIMANFVSGRILNRACFLGIDRENDRAALRTILEAARLLKEDVASYGIYPEGTRHAGTELLPFRNGAFKIAQKAKVPIVVAAIRGTDKIHKNFFWRSTEVRFKICAVLDAETVCAMSTSEIGEAAGNLINEAMNEE